MLYSAKVMVVNFVVVVVVVVWCRFGDCRVEDGCKNFARVRLCKSQNGGARVCTLAKNGPIFESN